MGENSAIEWTHHTQNFWIGCQEVSPACDHCYAKRQNGFRGWVDGWGPDGERRITKTWRKPVTLNKAAMLAGRRDRMFCNSLSDFFDKKALPEWRERAWNVILATPSLDWLILTKRPQNIAKMLPPNWGDGYPNVWLGTTAENQEEYDRRRLHLLSNKASVYFYSAEPMLGPVIRDLANERGKTVWYICGGESGPGKRPMDLAWARSLRDQCAATKTPFFMKQIDGKQEIPADLMVRQFPASTTPQER